MVDALFQTENLNKQIQTTPPSIGSINTKGDDKKHMRITLLTRDEVVQ